MVKNRLRVLRNKMNYNKMEKFAREILNEEGLRTKLREKVPQIERFESLDSLKDILLTRMITDPIFVVYYEGIANQELYPHIRANLIKKGVINIHNVLDSSIGNKSQEDEYEEIRFGISGNSIQVLLRAYNPNYKRLKKI